MADGCRLCDDVESTIAAPLPGLGVRAGATLGFHSGSTLSLVASTLILIVLLVETTKLYARHAHAKLLANVLEASQALSSEIEWPKLLERLMKISLENSGASRGLLILPRGNDYRIEAEARPGWPPQPIAVFCWICLVFTGAIIGYSAYLELLARTTPSLAVSYTYVNPVVALALGVLVGHETVTGYEWLAAAIILIGVLMLLWRKPVGSKQPSSAG